MTNELWILTATAASLGFVHTVVGPDHYLPFIMMARARGWTSFKTSMITMLCGFGHVGSSILIGVIGIALGLGVSKLEFMEDIRGNLAGWVMVIFGLAYTVYGLWRALKNKPHTHFHRHIDGELHTHDHIHGNDHRHEHNRNITPWILFTIFVLGPCEPLIPLMFVPAEQNNVFGIVMVSVVFSFVTVATMIVIVLISFFGIHQIPFGKLEKYSHAMAGAIILLSGLGIQFWNW